MTAHVLHGASRQTSRKQIVSPGVNMPPPYGTGAGSSSTHRYWRVGARHDGGVRMSVAPPKFHTLVPSILGGRTVGSLHALEPAYAQAKALDELIRTTAIDDVMRDGPALGAQGREVFSRYDV